MCSVRDMFDVILKKKRTWRKETFLKKKKANSKEIAHLNYICIYSIGHD